MSLYKKHRPKELSELRGNEDLVQSLPKLLSNPKTMPHSFLLTGGTGCGKTTVGRIIGNFLEVKEIDFQEINSSDFRGIDTIRSIINNAQYKPVESKYRVFLLDECHKLSNDAQNALLKVLEDTPQHVIFILCTTDADKLISAIKGRCITYHLQPLNEKEMKILLKKVARAEGESIEPEILEQILMDAQGHSRNALQILEKVLATEPENRLKAAKQHAAEVNQSIELCRALIGKGDWKEIKVILSGLTGQDAESIRRQVLGYANAVLLKGGNPKAGLVLECFIEPFYNTGFPGLTYACYSVVEQSK